MKRNFDKDKIKNELTIEEVQSFVDDLGAESRLVNNDILVCKTICHGGESHKLYYYNNTHLFNCYTDCGDRFDIYELTKKVYNLKGEEWSLPRAIAYVASYFGYSANFDVAEKAQILPQDWEYIRQYEKIGNLNNKQIVELKHYSKDIINRFPTPRILDWEKEGISHDIIKNNHICYNPNNQSIIIPHYDYQNNLIGIRERTLIKENEIFGKYRPAIINGQMYNHPLSFNLYNLNNSKNNIKMAKMAIVFEGEKSTLLYTSLFGEDNDISVACCGSSLITYQVKLLMSLGVSEIVVAFDKQFKEIGDSEFQRWVKKLTQIHKKYSNYVDISFIFDRTGTLLQYKDSPIDRGRNVFLKLFERRIRL